MKINYIKHKEIDKLKWDACIEGDSNSLIYAFSWYLDTVSPNWEALVYDDYEIVMPLPVKRKFGIWYITQPYYVQQLGLFGDEVSEERLTQFINRIPKKFLSVDFNLNRQLDKSIALPNYELSLGKEYEEIRVCYNKNLKRSLNKAIKDKLVIKEYYDTNEILNFLHINSRFKLELEHYKILEKLIIKSNDVGVGKVMTCFNKDVLVSFAFFLETKSRIIFLAGAVSNEGKRVGAMPFLIDNYIKSHSEKNLIFDFEGSVDEGVARFYKSFGAKYKEYFRFRKDIFN